MSDYNKRSTTNEKQRRKLLAKSYKENRKQDFLSSLPMPKALFYKLFDYLDEQLSVRSCNHTLEITLEFLQKHGQPITEVTEWLYSNGGGCDCEVLCNIEDKFEE
ncbi:MAG: DUF2695 domain-containing protein [Roseburia sp.]|nr:DUF2695 domain-containing protein [Roseburia sp.]